MIYDAIQTAKKLMHDDRLTSEEKQAIFDVLTELHNRPSKENLANLTWEFGVTLGHFADSKDDAKEDLYAKALVLNAQNGYGLYYVIDDFIDSVKRGCFIDYDGIGRALDYDGNELDTISCNVKALEQLKQNGAVFVAWFNK